MMTSETSTTARGIEQSNGLACSFWLRKASLALRERDVLDALRDAETLLQIARERAAAAGIPQRDPAAALRTLVDAVNVPRGERDALTVFAAIERARYALGET